MEEQVLISKIRKIRNIHKVFLFMLFGALWAFAQVEYSFAFLTWFAFVPFLFNIKYEKYKKGLLYSWIFGFTFYMVRLWWFTLSLGNIFASNSDLIIIKILFWCFAFLLNVILCVYHGLMYTVIFFFARFISKKKSYLFYLTIPIIVTVVDCFMPKYWYDQIGYSQFVFFHFSQIVDLFGIPIITFIIISCNSAVLILIESIMFKIRIKRAVLIFSGVIVVIIGASLYGFFRYKNIVNISEKSKMARIGIVQGNIGGFKKSDHDLNVTTYNELSRSLLPEKPDLIVWPETAILRSQRVDKINYDDIKTFNKVPLAAGMQMKDILQLKNGKRKKIYHNSIVFIDKNNKKIDHYHKRKLVPFGERMPPIIAVVINVHNLLGYGEYYPGKEFKIMSTDYIKFSPNICYEAIIPDLIRKSLNVNGVESNLILNGTNDSWYGKTIEPKAHYRVSGFRAIENRKSFIRATCTGHSVAFNAAGELLYESNLYEKDARVIDIPLLEIKTVYRSWGWLFKWLLLVVLLTMLVLSFFRKRNFKNKKSELINNKLHNRDLKNFWLKSKL